MSGDWADERAREWIVGMNLDGKSIDPVWLDTTSSGGACLASLAALLRKVNARGAMAVRAEILRELEKL